MEQSSERRKSNRLPAPFEITCYLRAGKYSCLGTLKDLSLCGCYIGCDSFVHLSQACEVDIVLQGKNSLLKIEGIKGEVIRCDENGVAIQFKDRMEWFPLLSSHLCHTL